MIFLTGDTHGDTNIDRYNPYCMTDITTTNDDYLIILGDFGMLWEYDSDTLEKAIVDVISQQNHKVLFVDGNHENFYRINNLDQVEMFGSVVGKYNDQIYHLKRGNIYTIEDKTLFVMGGAKSIDNANRTEFVDWWQEEIPSYQEVCNGENNLRLNDFKVDYILSHTCSTTIKKMYFEELKAMYFYIDDCKVSDYLDKVINEWNVEFKKMYFGHMHDIWTSKDGKYNMLYENFITL